MWAIKPSVDIPTLLLVTRQPVRATFEKISYSICLSSGPVVANM
jgi:hypothetical protein